ncbi:MAG: hypothetical protein ACKO5K_01485, partial [Armatimonadota bacterium]
ALIGRAVAIRALGTVALVGRTVAVRALGAVTLVGRAIAGGALGPVALVGRAVAGGALRASAARGSATRALPAGATERGPIRGISGRSAGGVVTFLHNAIYQVRPRFAVRGAPGPIGGIAR